MYPDSQCCYIFLLYSIHIDEGSARQGSDYLGTTLSSTIQPGTSQNIATVQLVDDENIETNETLSLRMDNLNDARIVVGNSSTTTVLVVDDDGEFCTWFEHTR